MITIRGEIYFLNETLEDIYKQLDPQHFYRANRQQIINRSIIKDISTWLGNKVLVTPKIPIPQRITISKGRAAEFIFGFDFPKFSQFNLNLYISNIF